MTPAPCLDPATAYRLRPGAVVLERADGCLQAGIAPPRRALLPATPANTALLDRLRRGVATLPEDPDDPAWHGWRLLASADLLATAASPLEAALLHGLDADTRLARRAATPVAVVGPLALTRALEPLLRSQGVTRLLEEPSGDRPLTVVLSLAPQRREGVDQLVRSETPHLVVCATGDGWQVGPFVQPGLTACLRCLDAALSGGDPGYALALAEAARHPLSLDHLSTIGALAWAARDVVAWIDGATPGTWGATLTFGADPAPAFTAWRRDPRCGCSWQLRA